MSYPTLPVLQPEDVATRTQISSVVNTAAYLAEQTEVQLLLKQVIETLASDLQQYAQKENASQFYIDRQNRLIAKLVTVYNNIEGV